MGISEKNRLIDVDLCFSYLLPYILYEIYMMIFKTHKHWHYLKSHWEEWARQVRRGEMRQGRGGQAGRWEWCVWASPRRCQSGAAPPLIGRERPIALHVFGAGQVQSHVCLLFTKWAMTRVRSGIMKRAVVKHTHTQRECKGRLQDLFLFIYLSKSEQYLM